MALRLPIGPLKLRDANPVPTSPLADDSATVPSGPVKSLIVGTGPATDEEDVCLRRNSNASL